MYVDQPALLLTSTWISKEPQHQENKECACLMKIKIHTPVTLLVVAIRVYFTGGHQQ